MFNFKSVSLRITVIVGLTVVIVGLAIAIYMQTRIIDEIENGSGLSMKLELAAEAEKKATENNTNKQLEKLYYIYYYVIKGMAYDTDLAINVKPGYLPDVEKKTSNFAMLNDYTEMFLGQYRKVVKRADQDAFMKELLLKDNEKMKGICFDYAVLMASMLRLQGIPAKLAIGYAGKVYHAWINVYIEEDDIGWIEKAITYDGKTWSLMDPTFVSTANSTKAVTQFTGEGNSYTNKYVY